MKISVTKADIAKGKEGWPSKCPVALALKRQGFTKAYVGYSRIWAVAKKEIQLPLKVERFMRKFDSTGKGKPFTFTLSIP